MEPRAWCELLSLEMPGNPCVSLCDSRLGCIYILSHGWESLGRFCAPLAGNALCTWEGVSSLLWHGREYLLPYVWRGVCACEVGRKSASWNLQGLGDVWDPTTGDASASPDLMGVSIIGICRARKYTLSPVSVFFSCVSEWLVLQPVVIPSGGVHV